MSGSPDGRGARPGRAASAIPLAALVGTLAGLAAFFLVRPALQDLPYYRPRPGGRTYDYWQLVVVASVPWAVAMWSEVRAPRVRPGVLLGIAAVLYVALIPAPAQQSQDVYQYLVYGRMAVDGYSPFAVLPVDANSPWLAYSSWHRTASVYGPAWTALSQVAVWLGRSLTGAFLIVKAAAAILTVLTAWGLARAAGLRRTAPGPGGPEGPGSGPVSPSVAVLAFAFNPLVFVSGGLGAHADVAVAAAFAWAVVAERRGRPWRVTALLAVAALVKPYAALGLAVWLIALWRRSGPAAAFRHAGASAAAAVVAFAPYWGGLDTFRGLAEIGSRASASLIGSLVRIAAGNPDSANAGATLEGAAGRIVALVLIGAGIAWAARSRTTRDDPWPAAAAVSLLYVAVTPWYLYWHLLGALALAIAAARPALLAGALTFGASSMIVVPGGRLGGEVPGLLIQTALRYAPPIAAGVLTYTRPRADRRPSSRTGRLRGRDVAPPGAGAAGGPRDAV